MMIQDENNRHHSARSPTKTERIEMGSFCDYGCDSAHLSASNSASVSGETTSEYRGGSRAVAHGGFTPTRSINYQGVVMPEKSPKDILTYQLLHEGISGASIYQLELPEGAAILKITPAANGPVPTQRAQRELAFYQNLAADVPLSIPHIFGSYVDEEGVVLLMAY